MTTRTESGQPEVGRLLVTGKALTLPAGDDLQPVLDRLSVDVPSRAERGVARRSAAHEEQYCIVALVRYLSERAPRMLPLQLVKGEAPDFTLSCQAVGRTLAVEHTNAGSEEWQREMTRRSRSEQNLWHSRIGELPDREPERIWCADIWAAIKRKADDRFWRDAPSGAERWLMVYDNTEMTFGGQPDLYYGALLGMAAAASALPGGLTGVVLLQGHDTVMSAPCGERWLT